MRTVRLCLLIICSVLALAASAAAASAPSRAAGPARAAAVAPRAFGEIDCNGLSPVQHPVKPAVRCKDPRGTWDGRFYENGKYIGHDEPSVRFLSTRPGSGNTMRVAER